MKLSIKLVAACIVLTSLTIGILVFASKYTEHYTSDYVDYDIDSKILNESRRIFVRLPTNYDKSKSYPLIIKTDGNFNLARWDEVVSQQAKVGAIEESIVVSIPNVFWKHTRNRDLVPPYARKDVQVEARPATNNSPEIFGQADLFLSFIEQEVLPFVEQKYSLNNNRVLSGFSAGGSFVLYAIVTKPDLFSGYFAFSPAAWYDDAVVVKAFKKGLSGLHSGVNKPMFLYLSIGSEEGEIITASFEGLLSAIDSDTPKGFYSAHHYSEGAGHSQNPYYSVDKALKTYYQFRSAGD